eukprot:GHVS01081132.1.p1 GENE.GHVS01081132.1~~GHVS01081132.1.p1  ORF type:complete len:101 (-),score=16.42 GHVS01081132.1:68-370(-)
MKTHDLPSHTIDTQRPPPPPRPSFPPPPPPPFVPTDRPRPDRGRHFPFRGSGGSRPQGSSFRIRDVLADPWSYLNNKAPAYVPRPTGTPYGEFPPQQQRP